MIRCSGRRGRDDCYKLSHFSPTDRERERRWLGGWSKDWEKLRKFDSDTDTALPQTGHGQKHSCHLFNLLLIRHKADCYRVNAKSFKTDRSLEKEGTTVTGGHFCTTEVPEGYIRAYCQASENLPEARPAVSTHF